MESSSPQVIGVIRKVKWKKHQWKTANGQGANLFALSSG